MLHLYLYTTCNFNVDYALQFTNEYHVRIYFRDAHVRISDAHKIWQFCLLSPASRSSVLMLN